METGILISKAELLELAAKRVKLPNRQPLSVRYDSDVDSLFLKYSSNNAVLSKSDMGGVIRDYDADKNLVGVEILDLQNLFD